MDDIIGVQSHRSHGHVFILFSYELKEESALPQQPTRTRAKYGFCCKSTTQCQDWMRDIRCALRSVVGGKDVVVPVYRVLALMNPFGGKKSAGRILEKVRPMFSVAEVNLEVVETMYVGHATEIGQSLDLSSVDGE